MQKTTFFIFFRAITYISHLHKCATITKKKNGWRQWFSDYKVRNHQSAVRHFFNKKMITANGMLKEKLLVNVGNKDLQMECVNNSWQAKAGKENYPMVMVHY